MWWGGWVVERWLYTVWHTVSKVKSFFLLTFFFDFFLTRLDFRLTICEEWGGEGLEYRVKSFGVKQFSRLYADSRWLKLKASLIALVTNAPNIDVTVPLAEWQIVTPSLRQSHSMVLQSWGIEKSPRLIPHTSYFSHYSILWILRTESISQVLNRLQLLSRYSQNSSHQIRYHSYWADI